MNTSNAADTGAEKRLSLVEHLSELRVRIIRVVVYITLGAIGGWLFYKQLFQLISSPVLPTLKASGSKFLLTGITEGFSIKMQMSVLSGAIVALPLITLEGWMFIRPGLTRSERKAVVLVAPLSILLFIIGVVTAYMILPAGIRWLFNQNPPEAAFMPSVSQALIFILKMILAFGLVFQMPVILMFLAKIGLINSGMLKTYWRHAIVAIAVVAAMATPSGDAFTMFMMCIPMAFLYLLSIGLVKLVEK